jgi:chaperonin GroES
MSSLARRITPLADRVLVRKLLPQTKTAGGIYLPETVSKKELEGEVLAVGPGTTLKDGTRVAMVLQKGDKVLLPEYGGHTVEIGNEELHLYRQDDILGKLE